MESNPSNNLGPSDSSGQNNPIIKLILVGEPYTGKTSLMSRFVSNRFDKDSFPTVGAAFASKTLTINGTNYNLNIWDTAGQETYRGLIPMYYRGAGIAIIVFDINDKKSSNSIDYWHKSLKEHIDTRFISVLCANKIDLLEDRTIPKDEIEKRATDNGMLSFYTSALTGEGVQKLFQSSLSEYINKIGINQANTTKVSEEAIIQEPKQEKCC